MNVTTFSLAEQCEVKLKGRMDAAWSDHVARILAESVRSGQHRIRVDMEEVEYISSAGIRVLVLYARQLKAIQGSFAVVNPSGTVRKVLELSGLESLLLHTVVSPAAPVPSDVLATVELGAPGAAAELFQLDSQASLAVHWPGNPAPWLSGKAVPGEGIALEFPSRAMGLGLGGFCNGNEEEATRFGEFVAAAGTVICLPSDGSGKPDYMLQEGGLTPSLRVAYGMIGQGGFRYLLRFDKRLQQQSLPFSVVLKACLQANGGNPIGLVMVAETASLTGVCLQKLPASGTTANGAAGPFSFPHVRECFSFTTEPAFPNTVSLVVGFVAGHTAAGALRLLKPLVRSGEIHGHFHAAVFPYQPLRKGKVELDQTVRPLFESGQIHGLLHLLNDWREVNGAGESRFLRGACWCSPLRV